MPSMTMMIKPSSGLCNLRCKYCFYADVADHRDVKSYGFMSEETADVVIERALEYVDHTLTFAFQGGEPTLSGLDFFKHFVAEVKKQNTKGVQVNYALQTNGVTIDEEMAAFFAEHKFLLGVSLDGPKDIHDRNRVGEKAKGSYNDVMKGLAILTKAGVDFNILTVVNKAVVKHPQKIYRFFRKQGFDYMQFIPCLDNFGEPRGSNPYALTPKDYGSFLCRLFDLWYKDFVAGERVSIRMFDNILQLLLGHPPESCDMNGVCSANPVVEADGSVYPCDFYVVDQWRLGYVQDHSLERMITSETAKKFVESSIDMNPECQGCSYLPVCRSGCRRHKTQDVNSDMELNYFCPAYKEFYAYTLDRFQQIAQMIYRESNLRR